MMQVLWWLEFVDRLWRRSVSAVGSCDECPIKFRERVSLLVIKSRWMLDDVMLE